MVVVVLVVMVLFTTVNRWCWCCWWCCCWSRLWGDGHGGVGGVVLITIVG